MNWSIKYCDDTAAKKSIEDWFDDLSSEQLKSVAKELTMLELRGNALRMPQSKPLGEGLFELRERKYGYRIYYTFHDKQVIILLAAGDKKSQKNDIRVARTRLSKL